MASGIFNKAMSSRISSKKYFTYPDLSTKAASRHTTIRSFDHRSFTDRSTKDWNGDVISTGLK